MITIDIRDVALKMITAAVANCGKIQANESVNINEIHARIMHNGADFTLSLARRYVAITDAEVDVYVDAFRIPIAECGRGYDFDNRNGNGWRICRLTWQNCVADVETVEQPFLVELPEAAGAVRYE